MREIYNENSANYPRLDKDVFFTDYNNSYKFNGFIDDYFNLIQKEQLMDTKLWHRFVSQFINKTDTNFGWKCEFWGKIMRGACFVFSYTQDKALYSVLNESVKQMLKCADENGRISTYPYDMEFDGWDIWGRKYVLLGLQYFLEICNDEDFKFEIIKSVCLQVDYIIDKIGPEAEGKREITSASRHWRGLNSSSILEPIVRLYNITGEKR